MTEAASMHSCWRFLGNAAHPSKFWQAPIELWREKNTPGTVQKKKITHLALLHLGQNKGQPPRHQNLSVEQSQLISHPRG